MLGMREDSWTVAEARQPDAIVAHDKTLAAPHIAERLGIPYVRALTVPMLTPTREFPLPAMVRHNLGGLLNRASYRLVGMLTRPYSGLATGRRMRSPRATGFAKATARSAWMRRCRSSSPPAPRPYT
jgi:sterol 3beta-glucosyltransferase